MDFITFTALISALILLGFWYLQVHFSYWSRRGFPQVKPHFLYGNLKNMIEGDKQIICGHHFTGHSPRTITEATREMYQIFKEKGWKYGGYYLFFARSLLVTDLELIKYILQKDFQHFAGYKLFHHKKDILSENLTSLNGDRWKRMRSSLSPTFSSAKMKNMFETMALKATNLKVIAKEISARGKPFEARDLMARYATDVIVSTAFGVKCNSLEEPNNEFAIKINIFEMSPWKVFKEELINWTLLAYTGHKFMGTEQLAQWFVSLVKKTSEARLKNKVLRNDFFHYLLEMKSEDFYPENKRIKGNEGLTYEQIAAQSFQFYVGGYETTSATMSFALLNLALYPEYQEKCRKEVKETLEKHGGQMTYETASELVYLEQFILESMRIYPPFGQLHRSCTKEYTIPGTKNVIKKGTTVIISISGIQMDADYYPNPTVFNPDNFSKENRQKRPDVSFLAFGEGPRQCIGMRFGLLSAKTGLASLLDNFEVKLNSKSQLPVVLDPKSLVSIPKGQIWLDFLENK